MLDTAARRLIDPPLNRLGRHLARRGLSADHVTLTGLALGLLAAVFIAVGAPGPALVPLLLSRLADGLDGAVARASQKTDFGGFLDITSDFAFYGAVPFAFALLDPPTNAIAAAFLLLSFYINGASFLGFAILAEKHGLTTERKGQKSLYFSDGLLEGTETILFFVTLCLAPALFVPLAWGFGGLCLLTAILRIHAAWRLFP